MLTLKLASRNLRSGIRSFAPFLLACVTMFVMIFVTASISLSPSISKLRGGSSVGQLMEMALTVLAILGLIILIYSYRFLQLQRSREFGLYDILGFGKGKITLVAFWELLMSYVLVLVMGTIAGIAFAKFLFLIFVNAIGGNYFNLIINPQAILEVGGLFGLYFVLLLIVGSWIIYKSSSLDLLHEESKGEKEPKSNIFLAFLGLILLAVGYYIAMTVQNPIAALTNFFLAVVLVIIGTYLFYISFTVWYLKWKKKRPSYYKKPENFITISSMLYRMKANATGLANITILLSMAVVTIIVTLGIFFGSTQLANSQFPHGNTIVQQVRSGKTLTPDELTQKIEKAAQSNHIKLSNFASINYIQSLTVAKKLSGTSLDVDSSLSKNMMMVSMTTAADVRAMGNSLPADLSDQQVYVIDLSGSSRDAKSIDWFGQHYEIKQHLPNLAHFPVSSSPTDALLIIFANSEQMQAAFNVYTQKTSSEHIGGPSAYFDMPDDQTGKLSKALGAENEGIYLANKTDVLKSSKSTFAGFVFIGFMLGVSFILGAALIIYYKQLSEGTQDKRSYRILQEVGLSKEEVEKTINTQVRMIFFLPLFVTLLHFLGAYIMISKIVEIFGVDQQLLLIVSSLTILGIALVYWIIYKATSRVYYKIVER